MGLIVLSSLRHMSLQRALLLQQKQSVPLLIQLLFPQLLISTLKVESVIAG